MAKIDWYKAELEYITRPSLSYDKIAKSFRVAKSTVVHRAQKYHWQEKRESYQKKLYEKARRDRMESAAEVDERHLKKIHLIQDILNLEFSKLVDKSIKQGPLSKKELEALFTVQHAYFDAVTFERRIKGLNTKPVEIRLSHPDDVDRYLETVGLKDPPLGEEYREIKETIMTIDQLIAHKQRLQSYIDNYHK